MTVKQKTQRAVWLLGIAALVLVWCSKSSPLYAFNDWMDANIFFTMGKSMLHGRVLYRDVFDHKGPVLYLLYGLAACVDNTGFGGVLLLETAAFAAFLWLGLRSAEVICGRALHPAWTALPAAAVAASRAFSHGGSAEELLLPLLAAALFGAVSTLRASRPMPLRRVVLHGFLAGCALWLKYTVLGFYLVWAVLLAVLYLRLISAAWRSLHCRGSSTSACRVRWGTGSPATSMITSSFIRGRAAVRRRSHSISGGRCAMPCLLRCCWRYSCCGRRFAGLLQRGPWRPLRWGWPSPA